MTTSPSRGVTTDADIRAYLPLVEDIASRLAGTSRARRAGAEYDDLVQEGLVSVWLSLQRGVDPLKVIENRMTDWIRLQGRLRNNDHAAYDTWLPIEPVSDGTARE